MPYRCLNCHVFDQNVNGGLCPNRGCELEPLFEISEEEARQFRPAPGLPVAKTDPVTMYDQNRRQPVVDDPIPNLELLDNTSERLPCILLLDGSASMTGRPIDELNQGLKILEVDLKSNDRAKKSVQVAVIRFGGDVKVTTDWTDAMNFSAPLIQPSGNTPMGDAVRVALQKIEERKHLYNTHGISYKRPWLFLITDGAPDPGWEPAAAECRQAVSGNKVIVFGIGVKEADMNVLRQFA